MKKTYGWTGRLLRTDLPSGEISTIQSMDYADTFIGGRMLGTRIYRDEVSRNAGILADATGLEIGSPFDSCISFC